MKDVVELQSGGIVGAKLLDGLRGAGFGDLRLRARRFHFPRRNQFVCASRRSKGRRVRRLNDHLQIGIGGLDFIERERVDRSLVGDEIEIAMNGCFRRMEKAIVAERCR